jgi:predicted GIY-YIG superfamily endonuclease
VFHVYVLANPSDRIYIGQTCDLARRLFEHNDPESSGTLYTKRHPGPWRLIHQEAFPSRAEAMRHEKALKTATGRRRIREMLANEVEVRPRADEDPTPGGY